LLQEHVPDEHLIRHSLASEAVLRGLAAHLDRDEELWGLTGLLHDIDYAQTKDDPARHGLKGAQILENLLPAEALQAIRAHNGEMNGTIPESSLDFALRCGETVTGLITANALVRPTGMEGMKPKSLKKKMKDKAFAAGVNRENIKECEKIGLELGEFLALAVASMAEAGKEHPLF
jgi:hypothetical protein